MRGSRSFCCAQERGLGLPPSWGAYWPSEGFVWIICVFHTVSSFWVVSFSRYWFKQSHHISGAKNRLRLMLFGPHDKLL